MGIQSIARRRQRRRLMWWGGCTSAVLVLGGLVCAWWLATRPSPAPGSFAPVAPLISTEPTAQPPDGQPHPVMKKFIDIILKMIDEWYNKAKNFDTKKPGDKDTKPKPGGSTGPGGSSDGRTPGTNGSGGPLADQTYVNFSGAGGSSQYHLYAAHLTGKPGAFGLMIYLHGDGHGEFGKPTSGTLQAYAQVARRRGMVLIAPKTPDGGTKTWWRQDSSTTYLGELVKHIYQRYNINQRQVWLAGYSGGAEVLTYKFLPRYNSLITGGGALMVGGGGAYTTPSVGGLRGNFSMRWLVGSRDSPSAGGDDGGFDALEASSEGVKYYRQAGIATDRQVLAGQDHYESISAGPGGLDAMIR